MTTSSTNRVHCAALLFDMDGVLIDSTPAVERVWSGWARERGFDPEMVVRVAHGRPSRTTIRELLPGADIALEDREVERREICDLEGVVALSGARELVSRLPAERWTIATSCTRTLAEARLRAAGLAIPATMVTSNDVKIGKPDPEPYLKAAAKLGFAASECVVVEDAAAGIRAGKAAGCKVVALRTTLSGHEAEQAGADWVIKDCSGIAVVGDAAGGLELRLAI